MPKKKPAKKKEKHAHEEMHILIQEPIQLRKQILGLAIDATKILKEDEEIHLMQAPGKKIWRLLHQAMRDMKKEAKNLENSGLPKPVFAEAKPKVAVQMLMQQKREVRVIQPKVVPQKPHTEMDRLNKELESIEAKLNAL